MIIILDVTDSNANRVESYNDGETLLVTPNLFEAIDEAAFTAEAREAVVRLRVGDQLGHVEITTRPRALRLKTRSLRSVAKRLSTKRVSSGFFPEKERSTSQRSGACCRRISM